ncbi:MAG TPA: M3 family metallopeptidase [Patescibacteria group bacterium]|jgi:thimet oligopeptidase|nr:M3 family metallopeptidase [Patescibacteria group bacterium]
MIRRNYLFFIVTAAVMIFLFYVLGYEKKMLFKKQTVKEYASLFNVTNISIEENTQQIMHEFMGEVQALCRAKKENLRYAQVFEKLDQIQGISDAVVWHNVCSVLEMVHPQEIIRKAAHSALEKMGAMFVDYLSNNKELYRLCALYVDKYMAQDQLTQEQTFFIKYTMQQFKRAGLDADEVTFAHIAELKKELVSLGLQFDATIAQDRSLVYASGEALAGVDQEFINRLRKDERGMYQLGLDYPTYTEIMSKCTDAQLRKKYYMSFNNRAYPLNEEILQKIIQKRNELAQLLGYKTFAEFDLADQMVGSVKNAEDFLHDLIMRCKPKVAQEFTELKKVKHASVQWTDNNKLQPWDLDFVQTQYKDIFYNIDPNEIAQYFPVEHTIDALLSLYSDFLGVAFEQVYTNDLWHDSVRVIQVYSTENKILLGTLLLDLYPRQGKYTHACQMTIIPTFMKKDIQQHAGLAVVLANFPAPSPDKPALLKLGDVRTFFHEFGHALHALLGATSIVSLSGTNTKTDFVELPSQLLEEWLWDHKILKRISCHYKNGSALSDDLIDRIVQLKHFSTGYFVQRQAYLACVALSYYNSTTKTDLHNLMQELYHTIITHVTYPEETHFYASFGHLYGYGAKYYGYLWSNVFAQDLFAVIKKEGLTNQTVGKKYVTSILKPGGTQDPTDMLISFLGRKPTSDAFFAAMGL